MELSKAIGERLWISRIEKGNSILNFYEPRVSEVFVEFFLLEMLVGNVSRGEVFFQLLKNCLPNITPPDFGEG
jgi:hypothetical protein